MILSRKVSEGKKEHEIFATLSIEDYDSNLTNLKGTGWELAGYTAQKLTMFDPRNDENRTENVNAYIETLTMLPPEYVIPDLNPCDVGVNSKRKAVFC